MQQQLHVEFSKANGDSFKLSCAKLPQSAAWNSAGITGTVYLGDAQYPFTLDSKGRSKLTALNISVNLARGRVQIALARTALAAALASSGAANADLKNEALNVPFALYLSTGDIYGTPGLPFKYSARKDRRGAGRLVK